MPDAPKKHPSRPRYAASLVLYRRPSRGSVEILDGPPGYPDALHAQRLRFSRRAVDIGDWHAQEATPLRDHVLKRLTRRCSPARARAHAMAVVRETYEETGLILGQPTADEMAGPPSWQHFFETGACRPCMRSTTRPGADAVQSADPLRRPLFIADGADAEGKLGGSGELHDLHGLPSITPMTCRCPASRPMCCSRSNATWHGRRKRGTNGLVSFFTHRRGRFYHRYE